MKARRESAKRGHVHVPIQAYPLIASSAAPAVAKPFRQPPHFDRDSPVDATGAPNGLREEESSTPRPARALAISAPEALAGKPHDEQTVANGSFGLSQAKQRQRYGCFMMADQ